LLAGFRATSRARDAYRTVLQPPLSSQQIKPNRSLTSVGLYSTGVPYSSSLPRVRSHHNLNSIPNQDGFTQEEIEELKFGHIGECGWENSGWQKLLERRLRANSIDKERLKKASGEILSAVRILGSGVLEVTQSISSTSSNFDSRQDTFPIRRLPSEIVVSVLRELDRYRDLSLRQFLKIIDFGCDRRTIGLGSGSHCLGLEITASPNLNLLNFQKGDFYLSRSYLLHKALLTTRALYHIFTSWKDWTKMKGMGRAFLLLFMRKTMKKIEIFHYIYMMVLT